MLWLLPPGIAEGKLEASVDAGVPVAQRSTGDMDGVHAQIDGAAGANEVVCTDATLRGEVPDACVSVWAVIDEVVRRSAIGRVFVVRPQHTSGTLEPRRILCDPAKFSEG